MAPGSGFRLVLFTTKGATSYLDFRYGASDILLFGRETVGVTDEVVAAADARLKIPIKPGLRSLNVAMAAAMAVGEALRQTGTTVLKEEIGELRGQGNLPDAAGRRRPCRPRRRVLPLRRLQSLERPRAGPREAPSASSATPISSAPTARWAAATPRPRSWPAPSPRNGAATDANRYVVLTGGEPLLQVDAALVDALHARGFTIGVETNGTIAPPDGHRLDLRQPEGRRRSRACARATS